MKDHPDQLAQHRANLARVASTLRLLPFPTRFAVEVTAECNLECAMCHHPGMRRPKGRMPIELWRKCADQIAAASPETQCWFSFCGEPLLEPELLFQMLAYGKQVGLRSLNVNSNGMPLERPVADQLLSSGVDLIVIGIDGFSKAVLEAVRKKADRDVLYANVEYLLERRNLLGGPEIQIQFIEMDENLHELDAFKAYWLPRKATLKVRKKLSWGGLFGTGLDLPLEERIACPWALTMMHVFWDGRVPRCPGDTEGEESAGNAWDEPLTVLWDRLGDYRRKHLEGRFEELSERCRNCKDWMTGSADRISSEESALP